MPYVIGIVLAAGVALFARSVGLDRDRAFYPTVLIVVALSYVLFASMAGSMSTVLVESAAMTVFVIAAVVGFKSSAWIVAAGLAAHGVFDAVHGHVIENPGVPAWWPAFCATYDLAAGAILAWLIPRSRERSHDHSAALAARRHDLPFRDAEMIHPQRDQRARVDDV